MRTLFFSLLVIISSCTSTMHVNVLTPSQSPLAKSIKRIAVVTAYQTPANFHQDYLNRGLTYHLNGKLGLTNRYEVIQADSAFFRVEDFPNDYTDSVYSILSNYQLDAAIIIQNIDMFFDQKNRINYEEEYDEYGNLFIVDYSVFTAVCKAKCEYTIYVPDSLHKGFTTDLTIDYIYQNQPIDNDQILVMINNVAEQIAEVLNAKICPQNKSVTRTYYAMGHEDLVQASVLINHNKLNEAIVIWKKLTESDNIKVKRKACYNMAVASEIKGSARMAWYWLNQSIELGCKLAIKYKPILIKREKEIQLLQKEL